MKAGTPLGLGKPVALLNALYARVKADPQRRLDILTALSLAIPRARSDLEQVVDWLVQANEDTFYKWQRRGSDTIAAALRERETAAGGVMPMAGDVPAPPELARAGGPAHVRGSGAPA